MNESRRYDELARLVDKACSTAAAIKSVCRPYGACAQFFSIPRIPLRSILGYFRLPPSARLRTGSSGLGYRDSELPLPSVNSIGAKAQSFEAFAAQQMATEFLYGALEVPREW
jgi:hypothetical protein